LPKSERVALTERARAQKKTLLQRWTALGDAEAHPWNARAALAADFLGSAESVTDLGCGTMILERYLRNGVHYVPVDVCRRDDRAIVVDFNNEPIPSAGAEAAACLGLLEDLYDAPGFMTSRTGLYRTSVVSCCVTRRLPSPRFTHGCPGNFHA
jgi:hypothetical protein